jgi:DnaJ-class molecular chaperone
MPDAPYDPERCSACRGSGRVISTLGGTPQPVECPWCKGSGRRIAGHDAQVARRGEPDDAA